MSALLVALCLLLTQERDFEGSTALACALLVAWGVLTGRGFDVRALIGARGLLILAGYALVLHSAAPWGRTLGACVWIGALGACWRGGGLAAASLVPATLLIAIGWIASFASSWAWQPLNRAAVAWSAGVGAFSGNDLRFGWTMQGGALLSSGLALAIARFAFVERRPRSLATCVLVLVLGSVLQILALRNTISMLPPQLLSMTTWLALIPLVIVVAICARDGLTRSAPVAHKTGGGFVAAVAAAIALGLALHAHVVSTKAAPRALFYSVNEGPILDWERPRYGEYGAYSLGLFGLLPEYLEQDGYEVDFLHEPITPERLEGVDALVTINVNTEWSDDELVAVWSFVHAGGSLLVLGDHTDVEHSMASQNDLLAPVGIAFEFDSAAPANASGWKSSAMPYHPVTASLEHAGYLGIAVGASLRLDRTDALPLVIGRYGLADAGNADAPERAYMGDFAYQDGERLGDCVLAAWSRLGAGKVLVFGDTSGFQNPSFERTYGYYIEGLFNWLTGTTRFDLGLWGSVIASTAFVLCALYAAWSLRYRPVHSCSLVLIFAALIALARELDTRRLARDPGTYPRALIDDTHLPRTEGGADAALSLDGLHNALLRSGYRVGTLEELTESRLASANLFVTVAPTKPYAAHELELLAGFMQRGGFVIACASYPHSAPLAALLDTVGLAVLPRPIGPIPLNREEGRARRQVEYPGAWEVGVTRAPESEAPWVYGDYRGTPLAMLARHGRGGLFLVGDSAFFGAGNLETLEDYSEPNILFLRALLDDLAELRAQEQPR